AQADAAQVPVSPVPRLCARCGTSAGGLACEDAGRSARGRAADADQHRAARREERSDPFCSPELGPRVPAAGAADGRAPAAAGTACHTLAVPRRRALALPACTPAHPRRARAAVRRRLTARRGPSALPSPPMRLLWCVLLAIGLTATDANAQQVARDVPYVAGGHERQVLDVYAPGGATNAPVVFWIHGGGWQTGHKGLVARKPQAFTDAGYVFVSINHRLLPEVEMRAIIEDVASAMKWVHDNIAGYGGDPSRVLVMGHSSGGQLAAITCTDHRYLARHGLSLSMIRGCVPVDADTFDIPAIIEMAETRARLHGLPVPTYGHR